MDFLKSYKEEDLRDTLTRKIMERNIISELWATLTRDLANKELSMLLLDLVVMKWVDIRARSFVSSYIQLIKIAANKKKTKLTLSKKAEPALRKTLS